VAGTNSSIDSAVDFVRDLAQRGDLARRMSSASGAERLTLRRGAYEIVWPVVFLRLTRRLEVDRGHRVCATSVRRLEPDCLDRFEDDVEAVLENLLRNAKVPIANLEGWITHRLTAATVDAHRRRRGERGALQRPRLPGWLADALGHDAWLTDLAIEMLNWVGIAVTAGTGIWPLGAWAERRARVTGDYGRADTEVARDVEGVLAAMRGNPGWYLRYIERPLGHKQAPILPAPRTDQDATRELSPLPLVHRQEVDDARLLALAETAVEAIGARLAGGEELRPVVVDVIGTVFGVGTGAEDLDRPPATGPRDDERVTLLLADPAVVERIVTTVLDLLSIPAC
jgi:hypothetical protein